MHNMFQKLSHTNKILYCTPMKLPTKKVGFKQSAAPTLANAHWCCHWLKAWPCWEKIKMTIPDESRDRIGKCQEIRN